MAKRTGSADLPLHTGRVPPWLAARMATLGAVICQAIVYHFASGQGGLSSRVKEPGRKLLISRSLAGLSCTEPENELTISSVTQT